MKIDVIELGILDTNCYILSDEDTNKAIVIDPGSNERKLIDFIVEQGLFVTHILITHGHFDHVGGVKKLKDELLDLGMNPLVTMSKLEKDHMEIKAASKYRKQFFELDIDIKDEEEVDFGIIKFKSILLPGHTNFSMCFYSKENNLVFVGDTLFYHSIGTEYYYDGPASDLSENIVKKLFVLPESTMVYPGHKQRTTIGEEIARNPYLSDSDTIDPWII